MSLALHIHPLSMPSWAVLIALYENETPFELKLVSFEQNAVVKDLERFDDYVPRLIDSSGDASDWKGDEPLLTHIGQRHPGRLIFESDDSDLEWQIGAFSHCFRHLHEPMLELLSQGLLPGQARDAARSERARDYLEKRYDELEKSIARADSTPDRPFTVGDCWAAAALYHVNRVHPFDQRHELTEYWRRLSTRPSVMRVIRECEPYLDRISEYGVPVMLSPRRQRLIETWFEMEAELAKGPDADWSKWEPSE